MHPFPDHVTAALGPDPAKLTAAKALVNAMASAPAESVDGRLAAALVMAVCGVRNETGW